MEPLGLITTEGFSKSLQAAQQEGWYIRPTKFALAETKGILSKTRTLSDLEPTWFEGWLGGNQVLSPNSIMIYCSVPPQQSETQKSINEIYLLAEDGDENDFLLFLAQPEYPVIYDPNGTTRFRLQISIVNLNIGATFQFVYTQAQEIEEHNVDPSSHYDIRDRFTSIGYPTNIVNHAFVGQLTDEIPSFSENVEDGDVVFLNTANKFYDRAIADGTAKERAVGIASLLSVPKAVRSGGFIQTNYHLDPYNFPNDAIIYLSSKDFGKITTVRTKVPLGIHMYTGLCYFPPAAGYMKWTGIGGSGRNPIFASSDITAMTNDCIMASSSDSPFAIRLPLSPNGGDVVEVIDTDGSAKNNNITVSGQGRLINRVLEDFIIDVNYAKVIFIFDNRANNWIVDIGGSQFSVYLYENYMEQQA